LVEAEARELVQGSFLADAPIIRTSATTGEGIDALRAALKVAAGEAIASRSVSEDAPFRMAIDRCFTIEGHGTVVTGSVSSGAATVGDALVIQPDELEVRIRGIHNHDAAVETVGRGQRAAINLAGVHHEQIQRGHELAASRHLKPSRLITVQLHLGEAAPRPLKQRARVRLHVGTAEVLGVVSLMGQGGAIEPGRSAFVQLHLSEPVATVWNQPFVLRSESPVLTIGGGRILLPDAEKIRMLPAATSDKLHELAEGSEAERAAAAVFFAPPSAWRAEDLPRLAGVTAPEAVVARLVEEGTLVPLPVSPTQTVNLHADVLADWERRIVQQLTRLHDEHPMQSLMEVTQVIQAVGFLARPTLLQAVIERMAENGVVRLTERGVGLSDRQPKLTLAQKQLYQKIVAQFETAAFQPPTVKELEQQHPTQRKDVAQLIQIAVNEGALKHIAGDMFLHAPAEQEMRDTVATALRDQEGMTLSAIRELLGTTRKYAVPFCEYLDKIGVTKRSGDLRVLGSA
ncbi:MAG: SelB C-terminal domain-containing protein, partial [Planctomycetota bacterium]